MVKVSDNASQRSFAVRETGREETAGAERQYLYALIRALARPRLAGSAGAWLSDRTLRHHFESYGYRIEELPFSFSTWPGRLTVPLVGSSYLALTLTAAGLLLRDKKPNATAVLLTVPPLIGGLAVAASTLVGTLPWGRVQTANWVASRPGVRPKYLIMAHRDSKSQTVSTYTRTASAAAATIAWAALLSLALTAPHPRKPRPGRKLATGIAATLAAWAGSELVRCQVGNQSPGALDNASGLAALLGIARREREHDDVAFLITDGEEFWLAGARVLAGQLAESAGVINLDGLDDEGAFYLIDRLGWPPRQVAPRLTTALVDAAAELGLPLSARRLPVGILLDHIPLARAGHPAVTLLRGNRRSLRRVHRPDDSADRLTGAGVLRAVQLVCNALRLARERSAP